MKVCFWSSQYKIQEALPHPSLSAFFPHKIACDVKIATNLSEEEGRLSRAVGIAVLIVALSTTFIVFGYIADRSNDPFYSEGVYYANYSFLLHCFENFY